MNNNKKQLLQESWLEMLGSWSKSLLSYMYGKDIQQVATLDSNLLNYLSEDDESEQGGGRKFIIRGKYRDVKAYAKAIVSEKNYLDDYVEYGPDHPKTAKTRAILNTAIQEFKSTTGLIWPFTDEE
jgi:hypothetical protein